MKRKRKQYRLGGTIKRHIKSPDEAIRENQISMAKADEKIANNPFIQGMDMFGGLAMQVGMSMMGGAGKAEMIPENEIQDQLNEVIGVDINAMKADDYDTEWVAKGTGAQGTKGVQINAEDGEMLETPDGDVAEIKGKKHTEGGEDLTLQEGTLIFSDQIKIAGKTPADRKKDRESKMDKALKALEKDSTDGIAKETYARIKKINEIEQEADLKVQAMAKGMDEIYKATFGTGGEGIQSFAKGTDEKGILWGGIKDFFGGFTGGDAMSLAGNLYTGMSAVKSAKANAATNQLNVNHMQSVGDESIRTMEDAQGALAGQQEIAGQKIKRTRDTSAKDVAGRSRSISTYNANMFGVDENANKAMTDLYSNFSKVMMDSMTQKAGMQGKYDALESQGAERADIANRMDKDNAQTQLGVAKETMGRAIQMTGKDLNQNKESRYLNNLAQQLSKYGLSIDKDGNISS